MAPRGQTRPPPEMRPGVLVNPGQPQVVAVTWCVAAVVPSLSTVVMVQEAAHDVARVSCLLARSLVEEELEELGVKLTSQEQRPVNLVQELRRGGPQQLSRLEMAVFHWFKIKDKFQTTQSVVTPVQYPGQCGSRWSSSLQVLFMVRGLFA